MVGEKPSGEKGFTYSNFGDDSKLTTYFKQQLYHNAHHYSELSSPSPVKVIEL